jgi:hypothetical protein
MIKIKIQVNEKFILKKPYYVYIVFMKLKIFYLH